MSKIEESNYKNTHEAKDTQTMIKDGLDVRDKPFSRQCGSASSLKVETQNKINASNRRTTSLRKVKILCRRSKYQKYLFILGASSRYLQFAHTGGPL